MKETIDVTKILFVSNGYSEDMMAAAIAAAVRSKTGIAVEGLPLVGPGLSYAGAGIDIQGPHRQMPLGAGFSLRDRNPTAIWRDIKHGLVELTLRQIAYIRRQARLYPGLKTVAAGDAFALWMAGYGCLHPVFVDTPISAYIRPHRWLEKIVLKRAEVVFTRDEITARELQGSDINARFVGSSMLDCLEISGFDFGLSSRDCIALLPGSRVEAYGNLAVLLDIAADMAAHREEGLDFLLAAAPTLTTNRLAEVFYKGGWSYLPMDMERGIIAKAECGRARLAVVRGYFGDLLLASIMVIGQAGTACEQAVGLGRPLLTFPGVGPQVRERFLLTQKRLLGDAVELLPADKEIITTRALQLLNDRSRLEYMSRVGQERMGGGGGVEAIADYVAAQSCMIRKKADAIR